ILYQHDFHAVGQLQITIAERVGGAADQLRLGRHSAHRVSNSGQYNGEKYPVTGREHAVSLGYWVRLQCDWPVCRAMAWASARLWRCGSSAAMLVRRC